MNASIEIRKTADGRIQARRRDGKPLTRKDREEAGRVAVVEEMPSRAWVAEEIPERETIQAVKIASAVLADDIWLILDRAFIPHDGLACYYAEEIALLRDKTPAALREIHKVKLAFPGCRVVQ